MLMWLGGCLGLEYLKLLVRVVCDEKIRYLTSLTSHQPKSNFKLEIHALCNPSCIQVTPEFNNKTWNERRFEEEAAQSNSSNCPLRQEEILLDNLPFTGSSEQVVRFKEDTNKVKVFVSVEVKLPYLTKIYVSRQYLLSILDLTTL